MTAMIRRTVRRLILGDLVRVQCCGLRGEPMPKGEAAHHSAHHLELFGHAAELVSA